MVSFNHFWGLFSALNALNNTRVPLPAELAIIILELAGSQLSFD